MVLAFMLRVIPSVEAQSSINGVELRVVPVDRSSYLYGEPFRIYLEVINSNNNTVSYYPPTPSVSIQYKLKNLSTGELVEGNKSWDDPLAISTD